MENEKIGKFIKDIRQKNNLTQKEFADTLGVTYQAVSKWENGKNIPDIAIIKEISRIFHIDIEEILDGKKKQKRNNKKIIITIFLVVITIVILFFIFYFLHDDNFKFKTLSSNCDSFIVTGSTAYNNNKSAIYISNIDYCEGDQTIYSTINCSLYEEYQNKEIKISSCPVGIDKSLREYLKEIKINVDNYSAGCKELSSSNLYLEINAKDSDNKIVYYKIPISLKDNCEN